MTGDDWLAQRFDDSRDHLHAVATRMLGSAAEADDAVQEAWLRLSRSDVDQVDNLTGWLTTVVSRICLDMLRSRTSRRELPLDELTESAGGAAGTPDPEHEAVIADSLGPALLVVLDSLEPAERLAFVLHDMFAVPFEEIAAILDRTPAATRQLASRARRRVQGRDPGAAPTAAAARRREIVAAFLAASRAGDLNALVSALDPNAVARGDAAVIALNPNAPAETHGAAAVAAMFSGRAEAARLALLDGEPGLAWLQGGAPKVFFRFTIVGDRVTAIDLVADPTVLRQTDLVLLRT